MFFIHGPDARWKGKVGTAYRDAQRSVWTTLSTKFAFIPAHVAIIKLDS